VPADRHLAAKQQECGHADPIDRQDDGPRPGKPVCPRAVPAQGETRMIGTKTSLPNNRIDELLGLYARA